MAAKKPTNLPYVSSVTSNLKSPAADGDAWTVDLGQKTLILGSNTSHKSAVLQAVELALSGAADDIIGRQGVKDPGLLLTLAPDDKLSSMAQFSADGLSPATFSVEKVEGTAKKPNHNTDFDTTHVLPHRLVKAAVAGGEKTARKAFLEWTADDVNEQDVLAKIPTDLHAKYQDISEKLSPDGSSVDRLLSTVDYAGKQQRDASKQVKGAESALESVGDDIPARPTDEDMEALEQEIQAAQDAFDQAVQAHSHPTNAEIEHQYGSIAQDVETLGAKVAEVEREYNEVMDPTRVSEIAARLFEWAHHNKLSNCPACNTNVGDEHIETLFGHWRTMLASEQANVVDNANKLKEEFDRINMDYQRGWHEMQRLEELRGTGQDGSEGALPLAEAQGNLEAAQAKLNQVSTIRTRWDDLTRMQDTIRTMTIQAEEYKSLKASCDKAVGELLSDQASRFSDLVSTFLPDGWDFGIDLKDSGKEVFRMGLRRGDKLHCALSGAESTAVVAAIAMATVNGGHEPRVVIPEDRAWDPKTLGAVMRSLKSFPGQIIMASTVKPRGKIPSGWTIIDADEHFKVSDDTEPVAELDTSVNIEEPSNGSQGVSVRSAKILSGMGFETDDVQRMTSDTAADLIRQGLMSHQVTIMKSGKYRVVKKDNVLPMSPNK